MPKYDYTADEYEERIAELEAQVTRLQQAVQEVYDVKSPEGAEFDEAAQAYYGLHPGDLDPVNADAPLQVPDLTDDQIMHAYHNKLVFRQDGTTTPMDDADGE